MRNRVASVMFAALAAFASDLALACTCFSEEDLLGNDAATLRILFDKSDTVVRVRVVRVVSEDAAQVTVTENFKGGADVRMIYQDPTNCGLFRPFRVGEEFLSLSRSDMRLEVGMCTEGLGKESVFEVLRKWRR